MVAFPNCKINLGLNIIGRRDDGYHNLETVFYPVGLKDALEIIPAEENSFQLSGLKINGDSKDNLCLKAYELLKKDFPGLPFLNIHLHKVIPMGAGLGGGSADGGFMLLLLNKKFHLDLTNRQLLDYALQLGSDCPFFILNKPSFATGRGEKISPIDLNLDAYKIVIVNPGIHVSTKDAFAKLSPALPEKSISNIIRQPINTWKGELVNDFEKSVFEMFPAIEEIKKALYEAGAIYSAMTGSGSTVFGIFEAQTNPHLSFPASYSCNIIL